MLTIRNVSLLDGDDFQLISNGFIEIEDGTIRALGQGKPTTSGRDADLVLDGSGLLAMPGLVDAHVHMGDSVAKDVGIGSSLNDLVHPIYGLKTKLLNEVHEDEICRAIAATSRDMIASGITTYADFREGGTAGVQLELKALKETKQRAIILGRPNYHFNTNEVSTDAPLNADTVNEMCETIALCAGIGLSGPNEYTDAAMNQISNLTKSKGKLLATHAAESAEGMKFSIKHFSMTESVRALRYLKPDFVVHFTNSTQEDLRYISEANVPVVCCPRANSILGLGFPPIHELIKAKVTVALGTDNVMLNAPDMFREMDYTSKMLRAMQRDPAAISSKQVLEMATLNGARALGLESQIGSLKEDKRADITFLNLNSPNLRFSKNPIASVIHRAEPEDVDCVMVDGEIVHGSIPIANSQ